MNGRYSIILNSQLGPKHGTITIKEARIKLWGVVNLLGHENILMGKKNDDDFVFKGRIKTPLGSSKCEFAGKITNNHIDANIKIADKSYEVKGEKIN